MKKRLLCVLVIAVLLLGVLTGCGGGPSGSSNSDKPEVGSARPDKSGNTDDPMAIMEARVKAVNDAINYECVGLEETVKDGLLFYGLIHALRVPGESHDYKPDKPLDYHAGYQMFIAHTEGTVNEDTYVALLKAERYTGNVDPSDVIETDDLYVYYSPQADETRDYRPWCYILVKDTDIVYLFIVSEDWHKADYYEYGFYPESLSYTEEDAEYIFTDEFWKAFAQTAKFVGNTDDDFKRGECINESIHSIWTRGEEVKIPYIEEWYAGGHYDQGAIREGFESFLRDLFAKRKTEAVFVFEDGTEKRYPATKDEDNYKTVVDDVFTIDLGNGQVWAYAEADKYLYLMEEPKDVTGERLPQEGVLVYEDIYTSPMVIDDFGRGEPTMFFNNGLYRYAGAGEVALLHDFSEDMDQFWKEMLTDAGRTHLMFSSRSMDGVDITVIDLKTFEIVDSISLFFEVDENGIRASTEAWVNGVSVDEAAAWDVADPWYSACDIELATYEDGTSFGNAWSEYVNRG